MTSEPTATRNPLNRPLFWIVAVVSFLALLKAPDFLIPDRVRAIRIGALLAEEGAGDPRDASVESMVHWFKNHPALALKINNLCVGVRRDGITKWPDTMEGGLCEAASQVAESIVWQRVHKTSTDQRTNQGGSK